MAMTIVLLMGFAALAVDAGIVFEDRRQEQAGADGGALAAAQFAKTNLPTALCGALSDAALAACRGAEEAMDVVDGTLPGRYSVADWLACSDTSLPAEFTQGSTLSPCINYTRNFQRVRVVLPGTDVETAFAKVIGFNTVRVSAVAEATVDLNQSADVLPFALGPAGAGANQACLFANSTSNLNVDPCDGPAQGNFGKLDIALYSNDSYGTPEICGNAMARQKIATNIVMGADHFIEEDWQSPGTVMDFANCPKLSQPVDNLATQVGNSALGIMDGLWDGISTPPGEGRITCKDGDANEGTNVSPTLSWPCEDINNQMPEELDHTPLWHYLNAPVTEVNPANSCDVVTNRQQMETCLQAWRDYGPPHPALSSLFKRTVETAPRFGAVPILDSDPSGGAGDYNVTDFAPTYLETLYLKCNANTCDIVHSPGEGSSGPCPNPLTPVVNSCGWYAVGNKGLVAMTAFILRLDMLDSETRATFPGDEATAVFNLSR
jgi:Flp pilus assembly protein TadG